MIQRKQTLFLLLAVVALAACLAMNIGSFEPQGMGGSARMTNFTVVSAAKASVEYPVFPLAILLMLACVIDIWAIFRYNNRMLQARLCVRSVLLLVCWCVLYAVYGLFLVPQELAFRLALPAALPVVAGILTVMARSGIMADERLVRAADRIR
ncbi:MAG: DUF4293 domain-containing protein [Prevotella sp.]